MSAQREGLNAFGLAFMGVAMGGDTDDAMATVTEMVHQADAPRDTRVLRVPQAGAEEALRAWGLRFEVGAPLTRMFSPVPMLDVQCPSGWSVTRKGGWSTLQDARGVARLQWYMHGWDPIRVLVCHRYRLTRTDTGPTTDVLTVTDAGTPTYILRITYPHPRQQELYDDGSSGWFLPPDAPEAHVLENAAARRVQVEAAEAWMDENLGDWRDSIQSWLR